MDKTIDIIPSKFGASPFESPEWILTYDGKPCSKTLNRSEVFFALKRLKAADTAQEFKKLFIHYGIVIEP